ncbi:MAG: penicillin-binding transpeptidase domain-containing protein [Butyricicoccus sp.]
MPSRPPLRPQARRQCYHTIDLDLRKSLRNRWQAISAYGRAGAVALDPNTGEVLAMASYPTYDLANYNKNYASIQADSRHPEVNRATSGVYPPGSTFKMVTAIAGLEEGIISGDTYVTCTGTYEYGGQTFRCNNHDTPMTLNVTDALKYSCNVLLHGRSEADR